MPGHPNKGEPGYAEWRVKYNARRKKRLEDPEYKAKERARQKASQKKLREKRKAEMEQNNDG